MIVTAGCSGGSGARSRTASAPPSATASPSPSPSPTHADPPADPQLAHLLLTQVEVSNAGREQVVPRVFEGGTSVDKQATLDECGATYPSESRRVARIQIAYVALTAGGQQVQTASNEVVRYDIGGVNQAFHELTAALRSCPTRVSEGHGVVQTDLQVLPPDPQLVSRQRTVIAKLEQKTGGPLWLGATFLYDADLFDGVYTYEDTRAKAVHLTQVLARAANQKLRASVATEGTAI